MKYLEKKKLAFMSIVNQIKGFVRTVLGIPPLTLPDCVDEDSIINYTIDGNSVQDGTPTPENPVEVECVGEKTKNLFDKDNANVFTGYLSSGILTNFAATADSRYSITFAIPCEPNKTYTVSRQIISARFAVGYSESSPAQGISVTFIANYSNQAITITTDDMAKYLYVWFYNGAYDATYTYEELLSGIQVQEGEAATDYEPYGYKIPVVCSGKNMFDKDGFCEYYNSFGTLKANANDNYLGEDCFSYYGKYPAEGYYDFIWLEGGFKENTRYTIRLSASFYNYSTTSITPSFFVIFYTDGTVSYLNKTLYNNSFVNVSHTTHSDKTVKGIGVPNYGQGVKFYIKDMIVEEGTTGTDYEPYVEPTTTNIYLDEPLRNLIGYSSGKITFKDYIDFEKQKVIRQVGVQEFDENYEYRAQYSNDTYSFYGYYRYVDDMRKGDRLSGLCTYIQNKGYTGQIWFGVASNIVYFSLPDVYNSGTDITERNQAAKDWFASLEMPFLIYYPLATPTETAIELPKLPTIKGTTIYSIDTAIQPSNMSATYYSTAKE